MPSLLGRKRGILTPLLRRGYCVLSVPGRDSDLWVQGPLCLQHPTTAIGLQKEPDMVWIHVRQRPTVCGTVGSLWTLKRWDPVGRNRVFLKELLGLQLLLSAPLCPRISGFPICTPRHGVLPPTGPERQGMVHGLKPPRPGAKVKLFLPPKLMGLGACMWWQKTD